VILAALAALLASGAAQTHFTRALELRHAGNTLEALRELQLAVKADAGLAEAHREIGLILLERRDFAEASAAFRRAVERNPEDFQTRYNLALSLANAGRPDSGLQELEAILKARPDWGLAWFGVGHVHARAGHMGDAEAAYRKALALDATLVRAHFELGKLLEEKGNRSGAIEALTAGVKLAPDSTAARFRLATLLRQAGRREESQREFEAVRQLRDRRQRGEQAALAYQQGMRYLESGDAAAAVRELRRAVANRPDFPESRAALAEAYERNGDIAAAIAEFRKALELAPSARTANHVGVLLAKMGRMQEAVAAFRRALEIEPGHANAARNLDQALALQGRR